MAENEICFWVDRGPNKRSKEVARDENSFDSFSYPLSGISTIDGQDASIRHPQIPAESNESTKLAYDVDPQLEDADGFIGLGFSSSARPITGRYFGVHVSTVINPRYLNKDLLEVIYMDGGIGLERLPSDKATSDRQPGLLGDREARNVALQQELRINLCKMSCLGYPFEAREQAASKSDSSAHVWEDTSGHGVVEGWAQSAETALETAERAFIGPSSRAAARNTLVEKVRAVAASAFPDVASVVVGSLAVGLQGSGSDADITLICPGRDPLDLLRQFHEELQVTIRRLGRQPQATAATRLK